MTTSQPTVLAGSGYGPTTFAPPLGTVGSAVIVDVDGLYYDEVLTDQQLRGAAQPFLDLAARGTVFDHDWLRYRDAPVNAYELLTGGYPVRLDWIPFAEDDPAQQGPPGMGFLAMPVPAGFVSDPAGLAAWHQPAPFGVPTLFDAAGAAGFATALLGQTQDHDGHIDTSTIDLYAQLDSASVAPVLSAFLATHPKAVAVIALGAGRTSDRHSAAALSELAALGQAVGAIANAVPNSLLLVTSRAATAIDDPSPDFYGPGSSKHVPLIAAGPNVRQGVVTSQDAHSADIPATVLTALGVPLRTDPVDGTWAAGTAIDGIAQPTPAGATGGHALVRMFTQ